MMLIAFSGSEHDLELDDLTGVVHLDQVDSVDKYPVDFGLELQHGIRRPYDLPDIAKVELKNT